MTDTRSDTHTAAAVRRLARTVRRELEEAIDLIRDGRDVLVGLRDSGLNGSGPVEGSVLQKLTEVIEGLEKYGEAEKPKPTKETVKMPAVEDPEVGVYERELAKKGVA